MDAVLRLGLGIGHPLAVHSTISAPKELSWLAHTSLLRHLDLMRSISVRNFDGVDLLRQRKLRCRGERRYDLRHDAGWPPVIKRKLRWEDGDGRLFKCHSIAARIVLPLAVIVTILSVCTAVYCASLHSSLADPEPSLAFCAKQTETPRDQIRVVTNNIRVVIAFWPSRLRPRILPDLIILGW